MYYFLKKEGEIQFPSVSYNLNVSFSQSYTNYMSKSEISV